MPDEILVSSQKRQYIIGKSKALLGAEVEPLNIGQVKQYLDETPDIHLVKVIAPRGLARTLAGGELHPEAILVANMAEDRAEALKQAGRDQLLVEPDTLLTYASTYMPAPHIVYPDSAVLTPNNVSFTATLIVKNEQDQPISGAHVYLFGLLSPAQGITDWNGQVTLTLYGETGDAFQGLHVEPAADYWSLWIPNPSLEKDRTNVVTLKSLSQTFSNFPNQQYLGWGQQAMNLDRLPAIYTGKGVRVAVIDSGVATSHRDLNGQVNGGYDIVNRSAETWNQDIVFHGTHCTGIIAGKNDDYGIRGFAPEAEVYAFKILPGGRFSDLIEALERCMELQIDAANLSIGSDERSQLVEQSIQRAQEQGIACIVAAGNTAGPVIYPASSPNVLTVAAIGKQGTFPADSYHSTQIFDCQANPFTPEGYFSARFTCFGPEVDLCGPGVAVLSSVPPDNFAVWDGTSMAAPHITGLAVLLLAHHPDFQSQGAFAKQDAQRVQRLFTILKQSARPLELANPQRVGAGLPDALVAFNLAPVPGAQPPTAWQQILDLLRATGITTEIPQPPVVTPTGPVPSQPSVVDIDRALQDLDSLIQQAGLV
jgi:subtilisin